VYKADFIVAHYAKFEIAWLKRCGVDLTKIKVFCTFLGKWVLNGNVKKPLDLDSVASEYNLGHKDGYVKNLIHNLGVCPSQIPKEKLYRYCDKDVELCWRVFLKERDELNSRFQMHLALTRNLTCIVLADIEGNGMRLDPVRVDKAYNDALDEKNLTGQRLSVLAAGVNLGSPKQLGEFLYDKLKFEEPRDHKGRPLTTATGKRPTGTEAITLLHPTTPDQREFLELYKRFNKVSALLSKNLEFFRLVCQHNGGVFRANFRQGVTGTHRLSSSGNPLLFPGEKIPKSVQFQNLPRSLKRLFYGGGEDDGASLEFRGATDLGNDDVGRQEILDWTDVHDITAKTLTKAGEPTDRQAAKSRTFTPLFGGMGKTKAEKEYAKFFKKKYKGISETQRQWALKTADNKELTTPYGMRFYWPFAKMGRNGYVEYSTEIYNYPIQGFCTGEIIPIALVHFWYRCNSYNSGITVINTVHDSIVASFNKSKEDDFKRIATQSMTTDVYNFLRSNYHYEFKTALGVGLKVATHWGDTKEETKLNVLSNGEVYEKPKEEGK
jgi:DNA polymerase-1